MRAGVRDVLVFATCWGSATGAVFGHGCSVWTRVQCLDTGAVFGHGSGAVFVVCTLILLSISEDKYLNTRVEFGRHRGSSGRGFSPI